MNKLSIFRHNRIISFTLKLMTLAKLSILNHFHHARIEIYYIYLIDLNYRITKEKIIQLKMFCPNMLLLEIYLKNVLF